MGRTTDIMIQQLWDKKSKRKALLILLLSDMCLFLVGGYLIYSWVKINEGDAKKSNVEISAPSTRPSKKRKPETSMKPHDEGGKQKGSAKSWEKTNRKEDIEHKESPEKQNDVKNEESPYIVPRKDETAGKKTTEKTEVPPREIRQEPKTDNETEKRVHNGKRDSDEKRKEQQNFLIGVRDILSKKSVVFKKCYTRAIKPGGERLAGSIQLRFKLHSNGRVENVITVSNTTGSTTLEKCILSITKKIHFPKPPKGVKEFLYPLSFSAQ